jgi:hypothetical protein
MTEADVIIVAVAIAAVGIIIAGHEDISDLPADKSGFSVNRAAQNFYAIFWTDVAPKCFIP